MEHLQILFVLIAGGIFLLSQWIKVLKEYERGVIFRLAGILPTQGAGAHPRPLADR